MNDDNSNSSGAKPGRRIIKQGSKLSPVEERILGMIAHGKTSNEIALALELSPKTVDNHRGNICKKLGVTGTASLLRYVMTIKSDGI